MAVLEVECGAVGLCREVGSVDGHRPAGPRQTLALQTHPLATNLVRVLGVVTAGSVFHQRSPRRVELGGIPQAGRRTKVGEIRAGEGRPGGFVFQSYGAVRLQSLVTREVAGL